MPSKSEAEIPTSAVKPVVVPTLTPAVDPTPTQKLMQKLPESKIKTLFIPIIIGIVVVGAGISTGWVIASPLKGGTSTTAPSDNAVSVGGESLSANEAGIADESTFSDMAEGILKEGGIDGEGTHHLDRGLGPEKYVYLTSTAINLQGFVGKEVEVWGQTIAGQNAGWLMDVGKIKVTE